MPGRRVWVALESVSSCLLSSCAGISGKSQILFALVFTTRYLDLFTNFISIYNTVMKVRVQGGDGGNGGGGGGGRAAKSL